jgi:putative SOS response-associated peptidase YedK
MCGRFTLAAPDPAALRARFDLDESVVVEPRWNVAPGDDVLAVTTDRDGARRPDRLRWGLVPHWAEDPSTGHRMINARAESVASRPAFRDAYRRRRCLIPADGFYEWQAREGERKQPWWITRADHAPFAFAGLWATWRHDDEGPVLRTCTIVTTRASTSLSPLHDRMPVMLPEGAEAVWLDAATPEALLHDLLVPAADAVTTARRVGFAVNDARHDAPDCLDPPPEEDEAFPATLFSPSS